MKNIRLVLFLFSFFISMGTLFCQIRVPRSKLKNEIFLSSYFTGYHTNVLGIGYEYTLFNKKSNYLSIQNELTSSVFTKVATDRSRFQTLLKWNWQKVSIISLGIGSSLRINSPYDKFSFLIVNSYKYVFEKHRIGVSGNLSLLLTPPLKSSIPTGSITGTTCAFGCSPSWGTQFRLGVAVGKYF